MLDNSILIKEATLSDATFIALLGRVTFTETFGNYFKDQQDLIDYYNRTFTVSKIETSIAKNSTLYWIATVNKLPVGFAKLKLNSKSEFIDAEPICQLQKIYVLRDFLSLKIGFNLQNILLERAATLGFHKIWLSVLKSNERAINFYRKTGFKQIGNHDFKIGKENFEFISMAKSL